MSIKGFRWYYRDSGKSATSPSPQKAALARVGASGSAGRGPGRCGYAPCIAPMPARRARQPAPAPAAAPAAAQPSHSNGSSSGETNSGAGAGSRPAALTQEGAPPHCTPALPQLWTASALRADRCFRAVRRKRGSLHHKRATRLHQHQGRPLLIRQGLLARLRLLRVLA